jgi:secreted PhoX family phosphatase
LITCEELKVALDGNRDGYHDWGWCVEIDPVTATVIDQDGDSKPDKLWKFGSMAHENVSVPYDSMTFYFGEDNTITGQDNFIYKFVADEKMKLGSGKLYALKKTGETVGEWVQIPNETKSQCNNTIQLAKNAGAWYLPRIEDVEYNPHDGKVYVTSTDLGQVIRFKDNGTTVSEIEVYLDNIDYEVAPGVVATFNKPDNLTFDNDGNLYVLQDGGFNYIWFVDKNHTPQNPKITIFACVPRNAEPTGLTFTPDGMFAFWSVQHPSEALNTIQTDATGKEVKYNRDVTMVMALKEHLGTGTTARIKPKPQAISSVTAHPNPVSDELTLTIEAVKGVEAKIEVCASVGTALYSFNQKLLPGTNTVKIPFGHYPRDLYFLVVRAAGDAVTTKVLKPESGK